MNRNDGGFTLIEVLIAVAITAVLGVTLLSTAAAMARGVERREGDARIEERRARTIELLSEDWRGATTMRSVKGDQPGLEIDTTADPLGNGRAGTVTYTWAGSAFERRGAGVTTRLPAPDGPPEFWDGETWKAEPKGARRAMRLRFANPPETVVIR